MATTPTQKFTTTTTGSTNQRPIAVLATQKIDALLGSIIQLDGRQSYDPEKQRLTWKWSFVQVPIGSALSPTSCLLHSGQDGHLCGAAHRQRRGARQHTGHCHSRNSALPSPLRREHHPRRPLLVEPSFKLLEPGR